MHALNEYALTIGKMHIWVVRDSTNLQTKFENHVFTVYALMVPKIHSWLVVVVVG